MKRQYDFLTSHPFTDMIASYKGAAVAIKTVDYIDGIVYINGMNAKGWTFCLKPQKPKK